MTAIPSTVPERNPAGFTSDPPYGPWADMGCGNPFFYHLFSDDFDNSIGATGLWVVTKTTGTAVHAAGDGGTVTLTTAATTNDFVEMQLPAASFSLPQGALAGKKFGFLFRLVGLSDVAASAFIVGMCNTTATPFAAIADGIYFTKASGSSQISLKVAAASSTFTYNIPTSHYSLVNATQIDFAFTIDRYGNILISIGSQLVGWIPQSGTGASVGTQLYPALPVVCPTDKLFSGNPNSSGYTASGYTLSTANLNPTIAIQAGANAAKALTADFIAAAKER